MVAVKGMLSMAAEARADTHRTMSMATTRLPPDTAATHSAMAWIRPVSSAAATTMNRAMKNTRVGHSTSCSSISTISTRETASSNMAPVKAAMAGFMCKTPWITNKKMVKTRTPPDKSSNRLLVMRYSCCKKSMVVSASCTSAFR